MKPNTMESESLIQKIQSPESIRKSPVLNRAKLERIVETEEEEKAAMKRSQMKSLKSINQSSQHSEYKESSSHEKHDEFLMKVNEQKNMNMCHDIENYFDNDVETREKEGIVEGFSFDPKNNMLVDHTNHELEQKLTSIKKQSHRSRMFWQKGEDNSNFRFGAKEEEAELERE